MPFSEPLTPSLFGLERSNRDFSNKESWGKNQFNSSFPASLCCYLNHRDFPANYLKISHGNFACDSISINNAFGLSPNTTDIFFAFESIFAPYQHYVIGGLPRTDLVIQNTRGQCFSDFEVKLTALPDNTTCDLTPNNYGCEIVVRPDTIVYLACSIARGLNGRLANLFINPIPVNDWSNALEIIPNLNCIIQTLLNVSYELERTQKPFLLQPIWKTIGKSPQLADYCLDVFFWSNAGFARFIVDIANIDRRESHNITRQTRTAIWLYKMLFDIVQHGRFNHKEIIDTMSYNTKNDKAFASSGRITNRYMRCERLTRPIIHKEEIKNIILGGGQNLLSPERRFDAIIYNSPDLFL